MPRNTGEHATHRRQASEEQQVTASDQRIHSAPTSSAPPSPAEFIDARIRRHVGALADRYDSNLARVLSSRHRHRYYYDNLARMIGHIVLPGSRVLDIGCLQGDMLAALRPAYGVGIDICARAVERARELHPELTFHEMAGRYAMSEGKARIYCHYTKFLQ